MENKELLTHLAAEKADGVVTQSDSAEKLVKFLIVQVKDQTYAFYADQIKEIVMNVALYFVPFVPPFIRGFINRHGEPYTVFDMNALFAKEALDSATFLISNFEGDQIAFLASSVIEILKVPDREVHLITSTDEHDGFFLGAVTSQGAEIFILNLPNIIGRLEHDLETG